MTTKQQKQCLSVMIGEQYDATARLIRDREQALKTMAGENKAHRNIQWLKPLRK